ncbi:hypothetical protein T11_5242 [Trichinella zimbabwensis]|uniref:Uncharacterized protein n=1 Tax=Trichinella zimbabwensis TaxID=268475 RepID=A0A0V1HJW0_9BILA|nr:hypothetical protein T11_5242 [Trichinella zimbabwensis]
MQNGSTVENNSVMIIYTYDNVQPYNNGQESAKINFLILFKFFVNSLISTTCLALLLMELWHVPFSEHWAVLDKNARHNVNLGNRWQNFDI